MYGSSGGDDMQNSPKHNATLHNKPRAYVAFQENLVAEEIEIKLALDPANQRRLAQPAKRHCYVYSAPTVA